MRFVNTKPRFLLKAGRSAYMIVGWLEFRLGKHGFYWCL